MKKLKKMWVENRILFVLFLIIIICFFVMVGVCISYFFGSSKSSYGDRLDGIEEVVISDDLKNSFLDKMKQDELIKSSNMHVQGKIVYITLEFNENVALVEAESKALAVLMDFEEKYLNFYDFHFTLKKTATETSEGFLIMGAKNVNGVGLVWNNNTVVAPDSES